MYTPQNCYFKFADTEEQAKAMCKGIDAGSTPYMRKKHPTIYTEWISRDGKEHSFVVWYYISKRRVNKPKEYQNILAE